MLEYAIADSGAGSADGIFRALSHERRRNVLLSLYRDGGTSVSDLPDRLQTSESDGVERESRTPDATGLRTRLHHQHLPALVQSGLVERRGDAVRLSRRGIHVASWLDELVPYDAREPN